MTESVQRPLRRVRRHFLLGCAGIALASAPAALSAQAYNATPTVVSGNAAIANGSSTTTVTVNSPQAIINWNANTSGGTFLPAGHVATYQNGVGNPNFAVLNRIFTTGAARFDGTVISRLTDAAGTRPGGTVVFQSSGGIIVGSTGVFDVGNLVLTTATVRDNDGTVPFVQADGTIRFDGVSDPNAAVVTLPGALINATAEGSWVAFISPNVTHGGATRVNGSTAYVAAESLSIRHDSGLFDIIVNAGGGTSLANPLTHTGSTGGPASTGGTDHHRIYMVGVPRMQAIAMLLSGSAGYDAPISATVENGAIVLSAGYNVRARNGSAVATGNEIFGATSPTGRPSDPVDSQQTTFEINGGAYSSDVVGRSAFRFHVGSLSGTPTFAQDLDIGAVGEVSLSNAQAGGLISLASSGGAVTSNGLLSAGSDVTLSAGTDIAVNDITAGRNIRLLARDGITLGDASALGFIDLDSTGPGAGIAVGLLVGVLDIEIVSAGALSTGDIESTGGMVDLAAADDMTLRNVRAAGSIFLTGGGQISALDLTAGTGPLMGGGGAGGTSGGIAAGFDDFILPRNDDGATGAIALPFTVDFFGVEYGETFVSNNGYLTFRSGQGTFTPTGLAEDYSGQPIIAAFFADVDTRNPASAQTAYGTGTFGGRQAFGATWDGVGYFPSQADKLNNFQAILVNRSDTGTGNFDIIFNYTRVSWETGSASGGSGGFGGVSAAVGYNAGTGNQPGTFFELPGSRVPGSFLDSGTMPLISGSNNGVPGQLLFQVRNGQVTPGSGAVGNIQVTNTSSGNTGNITLGNLSGANVEVRSAGGQAVASATASTGRMELTAIGSIVTGTLRAALNMTLESSERGINVTLAEAGGDVTLTAAGSVSMVDDGLGGIEVASLRAAGSVTSFNQLGDTTLGALDAGGAVSIDTGGSARFSGAANAPSFTVTSGNIDIAQGATLGGAATQQVTLAARSSTVQSVLGGTTEGPGWTLSNAEAGRIRAQTLVISAQAAGQSTTRAADLLIRDLTLVAPAGNAAGVDSLRINVGSTSTQQTALAGIVTVEGAVRLTGASSSSGIAITAAGRIEIVNPGGSLRILDSAGLPSGSMTLTSNNVWSASQSIINQLRADVNFTGRNQALRTNDGPDAPRGYIEAGDVTFSVGGTAFVQNSGTGLFAGITVVENTLTFSPTTTSPVQIFAFGRRINSDGTFVSGDNFFREVEFGALAGRAARYTRDSEFNSCSIVAGACTTISVPPPTDQFGEVEDVSELGVEIARQQIVDSSFESELLLEEAVTSGGDSSFWECEDEDDATCRPIGSEQ